MSLVMRAERRGRGRLRGIINHAPAVLFLFSFFLFLFHFLRPIFIRPAAQCSQGLNVKAATCLACTLRRHPQRNKSAELLHLEAIVQETVGGDLLHLPLRAYKIIIIIVNALFSRSTDG